MDKRGFQDSDAESSDEGGMFEKLSSMSEEDGMDGESGEAELSEAESGEAEQSEPDSDEEQIAAKVRKSAAKEKVDAAKDEKAAKDNGEEYGVDENGVKMTKKRLKAIEYANKQYNYMHASSLEDNSDEEEDDEEGEMEMEEGEMELLEMEDGEAEMEEGES